jgi:hypothetical protein
MKARAKVTHVQPGTQHYRAAGQVFEHHGHLYAHIEQLDSSEKPSVQEPLKQHPALPVGDRRCFLVEPVPGPLGDHLWIRPDTGEIAQHLADFPVGAMWFADWYKIDERKSPDGRQLYGWDWDNQFEPQLCVRTPGGVWIIDSRASNCTMPEDRVHRCWIRHGVPPNITVDKGGHTCQAGAGSIQCGSYHGFLRNGELVD